MDSVVTAFLLFLPAGVANMTPIFVSRLPGLRTWNAPIDGGSMWRGQRLLGDHKTWRGLIGGVICGSLVGAVLIATGFGDGQYSLGLFAAISFGALAGDAIESSLKRQRQIASGKAWFPFDQTDYIVGGLLCAVPFGVLTPVLATTVFGLYFGLHLLCSYLGYKLGLKSSPI